MTLGALTGMEKSKVEDELLEKREIISQLTALLENEDKLLHQIGEELLVIKKKIRRREKNGYRACQRGSRY